MRFLWTAVAAVLVTVCAIGMIRMVLGSAVWGESVVQSSCGPAPGPMEKWCVERRVRPGIPLLREERNTLEVRSAQAGGRYLYGGDPFHSDVVITWSDDAATLTERTGLVVVMERRYLQRIFD
jgi:hypothetical protein